MVESPLSSSYPRKLLTLFEYCQKKRIIVVQNLSPHIAGLWSSLLWNSTRFRSHVNPARLVSYAWCPNELQVLHFQRVPYNPAVSLYQPNGDNKTASLFQLAKLFSAMAKDNSRHAEFNSSIIQQCSGNNRIRFCRNGFSTTTDDTLLCMSSLVFEYAILALLNCPAIFVLLPDAPQVFHLAEGMYHVICHEPLLHMKNASDIHGVSISMIPCQACILRPTCHTTLSLNQEALLDKLRPHLCNYRTNPILRTSLQTCHKIQTSFSRLIFRRSTPFRPHQCLHGIDRTSGCATHVSWLNRPTSTPDCPELLINFSGNITSPRVVSHLSYCFLFLTVSVTL